MIGGGSICVGSGDLERRPNLDFKIAVQLNVEYIKMVRLRDKVTIEH